MRYLIIVHAAAVALFATMAVVMAVVWLLFAVNADAEPQIARQLPTLAIITLDFALLALVGGLSIASLLRGWRWRWFAFAAFVALLPPAALLLYRLVS